VDRGPFLQALIDLERSPFRRKRDSRFTVPTEEHDTPTRADLDLVLLKLGERQDRGAAHPEDLRSFGGGIRRQHQADVRGVFPGQEHSPALDSPELGGLQVDEDDDLSATELVLRIVLPDPRDDLSSLSPDVHLEDVQVIGVRMLLDIRDLADTEIEPVHGRLLRLAEIDLG